LNKLIDPTKPRTDAELYLKVLKDEKKGGIS
jgi:hypothetical protein